MTRRWPSAFCTLTLTLLAFSASGESLQCGLQMQQIGNVGVYLGACSFYRDRADDPYYDWFHGFSIVEVNEARVLEVPWGDTVSTSNPSISMELQFDLDPHGGGALGIISGSVSYADAETQTATLTWAKWLCTLTLYMEAGGITELGSEEDYGCWETVELYAFPPGDYDFDYWDGDNMFSTTPIAYLYMAGEDHTATAHFIYHPPPPPPPGGDDEQDDGDSCPPGQVGCTPIVVNLGDGGYELTGDDDTVLFDMNNDGIPVPARWTARGTNQAFLAFDRNGNGKIDDGGELFGSATPLSNGKLAANGFMALASLDANGDGVIDEHDAIFASLRLWFDYNHNGVTDPGELFSLSAVGITRLSYVAHWTGRRDSNGNLFRYEANLSQDRRTRTYYDVVLVGQ